MATFGNLDPSVLSALQSAANSFAQQSGSQDWTSLLGFYQNPSTALTPGTATLPAEEAAGMMTNPPFAGQLTLNAQNDQGFVFGKPTVAEQNLLGFTGAQTPQTQNMPTMTGPQETLAAQAQAADESGFMTPAGTPPPGAVRFGQTADGRWSWMDPYDHPIGQSYANQGGDATLANQENYAQQFGTLGSFGANGAAAGNPATLAAKQQAGNFIQNATAGSFANPFTAQAKLQGLQNAGSLGGVLGNNLAAASGTPLWELQNTPNLTNVQLGTDLANNQVGKPMSALTQNFLSQMLGTGAGQPGGGQVSSGAIHGGPDGTFNPPDGGTTVIGGTHYHFGGSDNPLLAQNPGAATPIQEFNKLDPSLQQSYLDLEQQMPNGQTSQDFLSQMKNAAPSSTFKPAAFATSGI